MAFCCPAGGGLTNRWECAIIRAQRNTNIRVCWANSRKTENERRLHMITGQIVRQHLKMSDTHIVADTIDYLEARFFFRTEDWDGMTKWVHFANGETVYDIGLTDACIRKEDHLCLTAGTWNVYLHGNRFTDGTVSERNTTDVAVLEVLPTGTLDGEPFPEVPASEVERILARLEKLEKSSSAEEPPPKDVNFYDYDGRRLYSYSAEELMELTALPELPSHDGLICQGWNWSLDALKALNRRMEVGASYITDDGKTRVYISLQEGRTSPVLGCYVNGTVTVDWGDGTSPDVLTGTDITAVQWTPCHDYAEAGDYVISLTVDGEMGFYGSAATDDYSGLLRHSGTADPRNRIYNASIKKIEIGTGVTSINLCAFYYCYSMKTITIPEGITSIGERAFYYCNNLAAVVLPDGTKNSGGYVCYYNAALEVFSMPDGFAELGGSSFYNCYKMERITLPDSVRTIGGSAFYNCTALRELGLNEGITEIPRSCLSGCQSLAYLKVPGTVTNISASAFSGNRGTKC